MQKTHPAIRHPFEGIKSKSDRFISWLADRVLPSPFMFYLAFVAPIAVLALPVTIKVTALAVLAVVSSNWMQWWALPTLQLSQNTLNAKMVAKADADHQALTHVATTQDEHTELLKSIDRKLSIIMHPSNGDNANG